MLKLKTIASNKKLQHGVTLFELVMVISILGIIAGIGTPLLQEGYRAYFISQEMNSLISQSNLAMERMSREMTQARSATAPDLTITPSNEITFVHYDGSSIRYWLNGNTLMRNSQALADSVTSLNFEYVQGDGINIASAVSNVYFITISLTLNTGQASMDLRTTLHPRRF